MLNVQRFVDGNAMSIIGMHKLHFDFLKSWQIASHIERFHANCLVQQTILLFFAFEIRK